MKLLQCLLVWLFLSGGLLAADRDESLSPGSQQSMLPAAPGYLARLDQGAEGSLRGALERAETLFMEGRLRNELPPASFVLHGPEVAVFFKENYSQNKNLIDLAARLSAFGVVDIQICETSTGVLGRDRKDLLPFVGTVPFGPAEERRLIKKENYVYF